MASRTVADWIRTNRVALVVAFVAIDIVVLFAILKPMLFPVKRKDAEVLAVLQQQQEAWNRGDLEGFMAGYWHSDELMFVSGDKITRGWQATFDRYKQRYKAEGKEMGTLTFGELAVALNDGDTAIVTGKWLLTMKDGTTPHGGYTLQMKRFSDGWKVVRDDTTSEP